MSKLSAFILVALAGAGLASAETLQVGNSENAALFEQPGTPARGMTQARVKSEFGSPAERKDAVGDPPITRWEYANFVVFFEYDKVIHSVSKR
ncbi:MAG: hypothetical protein BMS9Abin32_299 [Gammaproteobacteria bacterium]|nr:MAG: hypothetical protein BMS9Abin32_299 [Gammaproteobacteria bacterium]